MGRKVSGSDFLDFLAPERDCITKCQPVEYMHQTKLACMEYLDVHGSSPTPANSLCLFHEILLLEILDFCEHANVVC